MKRLLKNTAKLAVRWAFHLGQRLGVDILPRHFYSEVPDLRKLRRTTAWKEPYTLVGVEGADVASQLAFARSVVTPALVERLAKGDVHGRASERNGEEGYGVIEAEFLFAFVHTLRPPRIVQIGCGVSTAVCLMAAEEAGYRPEIVCVEPYPNAFLKAAAASGAIRLIGSPVEGLPPEQVVGGLATGDFFFVDSSHALGPAGEVSRIVLELLPRLVAGVHAHFHDIYFPYDYPPELLTNSLFFQHESVLLHAFLAFNRRFRLLASLSHLHHAGQDTLRTLFRGYQPQGNDHGLVTTKGHFPSSAFLLATV